MAQGSRLVAGIRPTGPRPYHLRLILASPTRSESRARAGVPGRARRRADSESSGPGPGPLEPGDGHDPTRTVGSARAGRALHGEPESVTGRARAATGRRPTVEALASESLPGRRPGIGGTQSGLPGRRGRARACSGDHHIMVYHASGRIICSNLSPGPVQVRQPESGRRGLGRTICGL